LLPPEAGQQPIIAVVGRLCAGVSVGEGSVSGDSLHEVAGWRASDKNDQLGVHANVCKALAARGLVAGNVNYRLAPRVKHPEPARDAAYALRWTRKNITEYQGDPEKVFLSGHSAGGHLAALIALDASYLDGIGLMVGAIKGVMGICGVYNLAHFAGHNWMAEHLMTRAAFGNNPGLCAHASPVNHVHADAPPFLLLNAQERREAGRGSRRAIFSFA